MTSNLGSELWLNQAEQPSRDQVNRVLQAHFRPEFLNRIDDIVVFSPLTRQDLVAIVEIQLRHLISLLKQRGFQLEITPAAKAYLAQAGFDPNFGARPLKRTIQHELQDPLALKVLAGEFPEGSTIQVDERGGQIVFSNSIEAEPVAA